MPMRLDEFLASDAGTPTTTVPQGPMRLDQFLRTPAPAAAPTAPAVQPPSQPDQGLISRALNKYYSGVVGGIAHPAAMAAALISTPEVSHEQLTPYAMAVKNIAESDHAPFVKNLLAGLVAFKAGNEAIAPVEARIKKGFGVEEPAPAKTWQEKWLADLPADTAAFLTKMVAGGKLAPEEAAAMHPVLTQTATSAIVGATGGERVPGETPAQIGAAGVVSALPLPAIAKVPAEMAAMAGTTALFGGTPEEIATSAAFPAAMRGLHAGLGALKAKPVPTAEPVPAPKVPEPYPLTTEAFVQPARPQEIMKGEAPYTLKGDEIPAERPAPQGPAIPNIDTVTKAELLKWADEHGYDTSAVRESGKKLIHNAIAEQQLPVVAKAVAKATGAEAQRAVTTQDQLPPDSTGWDAGRLRRWAADRPGFEPVDERRVRYMIEKQDMKPRDAVRSLIEEQYATPKEGLFPADTPGKGKVRSPEESLAPVGERQAQELGQKLAAAGGVDETVTAGLPRHEQTAKLAGLDVTEADPRGQSRHWGTEIEGKPVEEVQSRLEDLTSKNTGEVPPGGESQDQYQARQGEFWKGQSDKHLQDPAKKSAVVLSSNAIMTAKAAIDQGVFPDISKVDSTGIPREGNGLKPAATSRIWHDEKGWHYEDTNPSATEPLKPGLNLIHHGKVPSNPGPNYPEGAAPTAAKPTPTALPSEELPPPLTPAQIAEKMRQQGAEGLARLMKSEEGGTKAISRFGERVVAPAAGDWSRSIGKTWKNVNRFLGTGIGEGAGEKRIEAGLRQATGQVDLDRIRTEEQYRPFRTLAGQMDDAAKTKFVEDIESGKPVADPRLQRVADFHKQIVARDRADAEKVGIDTKTWNSNDDWFGRVFKWPEQKVGTGATTSIAGTERFLKDRVFKTYGEALKAVRASGGDALYDNPIDAMIAKHIEVRRSIEAHNVLQDEMARGDSVTKLMPGHRIPEGYKYLDDRLARTPGHRLVAPEGIADKLNQFIAPGVGEALPIWDKIIQAKRASVAVNFGISAWHVMMETSRNVWLQTGLAINNALHGEFDLMTKNLEKAVNIFHQTQFGSTIRKQARNAAFDPGLEPLVQATANAGQQFNVRSLLTPGAYEKAQIALKEGDPISGVSRLGQYVFESVTRPIMERFVPNVKAAVMASAAETEFRRAGTIDSPTLKENMRLTGDMVDNVLGQVVRSNQFQHRIVQNAMDGVFAAPKFAEGDIRHFGAYARDIVEAAGDIAAGKRPTLTPALYTLLGHAVSQVAIGTAMMAAYTKATTGTMQLPTSFRDFFYPRTGRKNPDGTDERMQAPGLGVVESLFVEGPTKAVENRVAPVWRAVSQLFTNADYRNVKIRSGPLPQQIEQAAVHVGKAAMPFSVQSLIQPPGGTAPLTPDLRIAAIAGIRRMSPRLSQPASIQKLHELGAQRMPSEPRTPEEAAKSDLISQLAGDVREHKPGARAAVSAAVREGKLQPTDREKVFDKAAVKPEIVSLIRASHLPISDLMQVWDAMTPDEKQRSSYLLRSKIADTESLAPEQKRTYRQKILDDVRVQR